MDYLILGVIMFVGGILLHNRMLAAIHAAETSIHLRMVKLEQNIKAKL